MKQKLKGIGTVILFYVLVVIISLTTIGIRDNLKDTTDRFKISELSEGVGIRICIASVNSQALLCDNEPTIIIPLYNVSQEYLDKALEDCVNAKLIKSNYCIGEYLEIYNKGG